MCQKVVLQRRLLPKVDRQGSLEGDHSLDILVEPGRILVRLVSISVALACTSVAQQCDISSHWCVFVRLS